MYAGRTKLEGRIHVSAIREDICVGDEDRDEGERYKRKGGECKVGMVE